MRPGPHGMAIPLATIGPGAVVGELSLLGNGGRTATVLVARQARAGAWTGAPSTSCEPICDPARSR